MRKSFCRKCNKTEPRKRIFNEKGKEGSWTIVVFDLQCEKCKTVTWNYVEATSPHPSGGKAILMSMTNVAHWFDRSLLDVYKSIVEQNETKA